MVDKILITEDLFDIANRIKNIDKGYFILFNKLSSKYEIHYKYQFPTYCLTLPYNYLDNRALEYVKNTSVDTIKELILKIEQNNKKIKNKKNEKRKDFVNERMLEITNYTNCSKEFNLDSYKTKWI